MTRDLTAVRQEVNNLDSSVVVQKLRYFIINKHLFQNPIYHMKTFISADSSFRENARLISTSPLNIYGIILRFDAILYGVILRYYSIL